MAIQFEAKVENIAAVAVSLEPLAGAGGPSPTGPIVFLGKLQ